MLKVKAELGKIFELWEISYCKINPHVELVDLEVHSTI